jgi:Plant mobile domain
MTSENPIDPDIREGNDDTDINRMPISPLLCGSRCMSRVYYIKFYLLYFLGLSVIIYLYIMQSEDVLDCRVHKLVIPFDRRCEFALKNLGLYQVAQIGHCSTDHRLITTLVERWRPETHTFHMPLDLLYCDVVRFYMLYVL